MFKRLLDRFRPAEAVPVKEVAADENSIYWQLEQKVLMLDTRHIDLDALVTAPGRIDMFAATLPDYLKSLMEINDIVEKKEHVENPIFYRREYVTVPLDDFLFVVKGTYIANSAEVLQEVLNQIKRYLNLMRDADKAPYGPLEHNHRHLYRYTIFMTVFLERLFHHFGE